MTDRTQSEMTQQPDAAALATILADCPAGPTRRACR